MDISKCWFRIEVKNLSSGQRNAPLYPPPWECWQQHPLQSGTFPQIVLTLIKSLRKHQVRSFLSSGPASAECSSAAECAASGQGRPRSARGHMRAELAAPDSLESR